MAVPRYTTLELVKQALLMLPATDPSPEDALITQAIVAVENEIDVYTRRRFDVTIGDRSFHAPWSQLLLLPDVVSITQVKLYSAVQSVSAYALQRNDDPRQPTFLLRLNGTNTIPWREANQSPWNAVVVTASWGFAASVPDKIVRVALDRSVVAYHDAKAFFATRTGRGASGGEPGTRLLDVDARAELDSLRLRPVRQSVVTA